MAGLRAARAELAKVQSAVASLVMEPGRLQAFRKGPAAYARSFGLRDGAKLVAGIDPDGAAYYASRRSIDRVHYLKADLPRTVAALQARPGGIEGTYFAQRPYAKEDPRDEVRQVLSWSRQPKAAVPAWVRDLVSVEASGWLLLQEPKPAKAKRTARLAFAPGTLPLVLRHDPDELLGDAAPRTRGRFPVVLVREDHDVELYRLEPAAVAVLRHLGKPEASLPPSLAKALRGLRRLGIVA